eukprot:g17766.t1
MRQQESAEKPGHECPQYAGGKGFAQIYARLQQNGPFDLIGFQECDNVGQIVAGTSLTPNFKYFTPPAGNDAPMAWNGEKFTAIEGPGVVWVARDKYGDRHVNWVRLQVVGSSETILFANTHGPLDQCGGKPGGTVATNYINAVNQHKKTKDPWALGKITSLLCFDARILTAFDTIKQLSEAYQLDATDTSYNGADHIFSSSGFSVLWKGASDGSPSDHQLLKAVLQSGSHSRCPVPPDNGGCCLTCRFNHYCPSNKGCYASGQSGCSGGYCPAPPEENWLHSAVEIVAWLQVVRDSQAAQAANMDFLALLDQGLSFANVGWWLVLMFIVAFLATAVTRPTCSGVRKIRAPSKSQAPDDVTKELGGHGRVSSTAGTSEGQGVMPRRSFYVRRPLPTMAEGAPETAKRRGDGFIVKGEMPSEVGQAVFRKAWQPSLRCGA